MKIGSVEILPIIDGQGHVQLDTAVSGPEGTLWDCPHDRIVEPGRLRFDVGGFLVLIDDKIILVDTGAGAISDERIVSGDLLNQLRRRGVEPGDVTDIFFTHMHWDHIGWSTSDGRVTFENATVHVHEADWSFFMTGNTVDQLVRDIMRPIETRLETFASEVEPVPHLICRPAPGHTPGSSIYLIHSEGERALLLGDTWHTIGELTHPEWVSMFDVDPVAAAIMRNRIAQELIETGDLLAASHFPNLGFGRLVTVDGIRKFLWAL